jgi:hypothetical protein
MWDGVATWGVVGTSLTDILNAANLVQHFLLVEAKLWA